jgi:cold shock CspA family protein
MEGKIEHLTDKGFGFIKCADYSKNVFFHAKDLIDVSFEDLQKGDVVTMEEVLQGEKGFSGKGIRLA